MNTKLLLLHDTRKQSAWVVRWYGEYDPATGKQRRHGKSFRLKRDAERFLAAKQAELDQGGQRDPSPAITLGQFCENYRRHRAHEWSTSTQRHVEQVCTRLLDHFGEESPLGRISAQAAASFWGSATKTRKGFEGKELSRSSRNWILRYAKTMFAYAMKWQYIAANPFAGIMALRVGRATRRDWHYITPDEYRRLLDVVPSLRWKVFYALAYTSGARFGELFNITKANLDLEQGMLMVRNRKASADMPPFHIKDHEHREIPLPKHTVELLAQWCDTRPEGSPFLLLTPERFQIVRDRWHACWDSEMPWMNPYMVNNAIRDIRLHAKKASINPTAPLTVHAFRKSCGQNWANHLPMHVVKEFMGHAAISTTAEYYSKVTADDVRRAQWVTESIINGRSEGGRLSAGGCSPNLLAI